MRIDRSHRPWLIASLVIFFVALIAYVPYSLTSRPSGRSVLGLIYGVAGYLMMLFAGLLGARKKVPVWRLGRAQTWMRGHLWLGFLTLPVILFHSGFATGGPLTTLLMGLLVFVFLSGVTGAAIQHFVPGIMKSMVPLETIYEEIPRVRAQLRAEADNLVRAFFSQPEGAFEPALQVQNARTSREMRTPVVQEEMVEMEADDREYFRNVYRNMILPFLRHPEKRVSVLIDSDKANTFFEALRRRLPGITHSCIADLENICEEERQLNRQRRLYLWLHGWLLVHVPLSIALLVLGAIHAVMALRY
jgi:hypothetical protein